MTQTGQFRKGLAHTAPAADVDASASERDGVVREFFERDFDLEPEGGGVEANDEGAVSGIGGIGNWLVDGFREAENAVEGAVVATGGAVKDAAVAAGGAVKDAAVAAEHAGEDAVFALL